MNSKDRTELALNFKEADRVSIGDAFWLETVEKWKHEGMNTDNSLYEYFGFDYWWLMFEQRIGFEEKVIEDNPDYSIIQNIEGGIFKIPKDGRHFVAIDFDLPGFPIKYMIKNYEDWKKHKSKFVPDKWRLAFKPKITASYGATPPTLKDLKKTYRKLRENDMYVFFAPREGVENIRTKLGTENFLMQMALDPKWMKEMFEADVNLTLEMYKMYEELDIEFDGLWVWGDIAYNKGSFISPDTYRKIVMPFHKKLFNFFGEKNMPVVYHCDGNCNEVLPLLVESGITAIHPLEVKAGMDGIEIKKKYGKNLAIFGNIDIQIMSRSKDEIKKEIASKIPILKKGGGYLYHSDHSVPSNVSLENYRFVLECVKNYGAF